VHDHGGVLSNGVTEDANQFSPVIGSSVHSSQSFPLAPL
jgi:hypothetical protein